jgi:hypothetical protein
VEEAEIESQLEALGRPMEVTEEAVRGRTQEMMEPYEGMTPFPIAAALGERFKKRMQERRGEKAVADFDDLSDDQQIIFQNAIKAEQWRADLGGRLPSEDQMNTIEWKRAQEIMSQIESGTLDKRAMIRTALQFAEKDLGRGAPPTDVRRQRDEIIERVMMLRANTTAYGKSSVKPPPPRERPKPVVEPAAVPAAAAPAGTGRGATTPASDPLAAEMGVTQAQADAMNPPYIPQYPPDPVLNPPSVAQQERVSEQDFRLQEIDEGTRLAGQDRRLQEIEAQAQANRIIEQDRRLQEIDRGSAVADVLVPPPTQAPTTTAPPRRASSFAGQYPTSPLTTQSFQRPDELDYPRAPTDAEWDAEAVRTGGPLTVRNGVETLLLPQETMDIEDAAAARGGEMAARVLESQARQFVASSSADEISRDSRVLNALAQEALRLGLPLPTWYTAQIRPTVPASIAR